MRRFLQPVWALDASGGSPRRLVSLWLLFGATMGGACGRVRDADEPSSSSAMGGALLETDASEPGQGGAGPDSADWDLSACDDLLSLNLDQEGDCEESCVLAHEQTRKKAAAQLGIEVDALHVEGFRLETCQLSCLAAVRHTAPSCASCFISEGQVQWEPLTTDSIGINGVFFPLVDELYGVCESECAATQTCRSLLRASVPTPEPVGRLPQLDQAATLPWLAHLQVVGVAPHPEGWLIVDDETSTGAVFAQERSIGLLRADGEVESLVEKAGRAGTLLAVLPWGDDFLFIDTQGLSVFDGQGIESVVEVDAIHSFGRLPASGGFWYWEKRSSPDESWFVELDSTFSETRRLWLSGRQRALVPLAEDRLAVVGTDQSLQVFPRNVEATEPLFSSSPGDFGTRPVVVGNDAHIFALLNERDLVKMDAATGEFETMWQVPKERALTFPQLSLGQDGAIYLAGTEWLSGVLFAPYQKELAAPEGCTVYGCQRVTLRRFSSAGEPEWEYDRANQSSSLIDFAARPWPHMLIQSQEEETGYSILAWPSP